MTEAVFKGTISLNFKIVIMQILVAKAVGWYQDILRQIAVPQQFINPRTV